MVVASASQTTPGLEEQVTFMRWVCFTISLISLGVAGWAWFALYEWHTRLPPMITTLVVEGLIPVVLLGRRYWDRIPPGWWSVCEQSLLITFMVLWLVWPARWACFIVATPSSICFATIGLVIGNGCCLLLSATCALLDRWARVLSEAAQSSREAAPSQSSQIELVTVGS